MGYSSDALEQLISAIDAALDQITVLIWIIISIDHYACR